MCDVTDASISQLIGSLYDVQRASYVEEALFSLLREVGSRPALDRVGIEDAVEVLLRVQHDTHERIPGVPFVVHPIEVATAVLHLMPCPSTQQVIAALLHDCVEDEPLRLVEMLHSESTTLKVGKPLQRDNVACCCEEAYRALEERYDKSVSEAVRVVTLPDFSSLVQEKIKAGDQRGDKEIKIDLYTDHVLEVLASSSDGSVVKMADLWNNALTRHPKEDEKRLAHVRKRYRGVVTKLPTLLESLQQDHPLLGCRKAVLHQIHQEWYLFSE